MSDPHHEAVTEVSATPDFSFSLSGPRRPEFSATAHDTETPRVEASGRQSPHVHPVVDPGAEPIAETRPVAASGAGVVEQRPSDPDPGEEPGIETPSIEQQADQLVHRVARELTAVAPEGWRRLEAVFALTVVADVTVVRYYDDVDRVARDEPAGEVVELVRLQREVSAQLDEGPWWRMLLELENDGELTVEYDYGDEPFPDDQLLEPGAYLADLQAFPRRRVPVWLAAYVSHDGRQVRSPRQAAVRARADQEAWGAVTLPDHEFPSLSVVWARWATIAAAFVAVGSEWGPRIVPGLAAFEGAAHSGSTLYLLPDGRAVLSGGEWNAPELDAAYNEGSPLPDLYAGAPEWVAEQVLNPRAELGLLSFCYWWDRGSWYRGESPAADRIRAAVPGVWSAQTAVDILCGVVSTEPSERQQAAAAELIGAAEAGMVTRNTLSALFDDPSDDLNGALYELSLAGLLAQG